MPNKNNLKIVASFYKYAEIDDPQKFQNEQLELCKSLNLKGRIMVGKEGINGSIYGTADSIKEYRKKIKNNSPFSDMEFKEQATDKCAFRKLFVRLRKEIVNFGLDVDIKKTARHISPKELKESLDNKEDIVLLDVRNDYEAKIGKFKNAVTLSIGNFREFSQLLEGMRGLKEKRIVAYCTGGIRCEKASAFLKESGFKNVSQLKGGILNFANEFPNTYFEGKCFVFDDRIAIHVNRKNAKPMTSCAWCGNSSDDYLNCHNIECDKLFICCKECMSLNNKSCSEKCSTASKRRKIIF